MYLILLDIIKWTNQFSILKKTPIFIDFDHEVLNHTDLFTIGNINILEEKSKTLHKIQFSQFTINKNSDLFFLTETAARTCSSATISCFKGAQIHDKRITVYTKEININLFACFESWYEISYLSKRKLNSLSSKSDISGLPYMKECPTGQSEN